MPVSAQNRYEGGVLDQVQDLSPAWQQVLATQDACLNSINTFLNQQLQKEVTLFPKRPLRALELIQPDQVRVVILGQDPYHGPNQAQGLAFSVPDHVACPPSLRNIFAELTRCFPNSLRSPSHDLTLWAEQGVLLLNTVLTVEQSKPASHAGKGWETITDTLITHVGQQLQPKVFMFWGKQAHAKTSILPHTTNTLVLKSNHPSPLSARRPPVPFIGCNHFKQANQWLAQHGRPPVQW